MSVSVSQALTSFLERNQLPKQYLDDNAARFDPIIHHALALISKQSPVVIGCNGSQGSGKSTLSDYLVTVLQYKYRLNAINLSIDDVYLSHAKRQQLAQSVHPLLASRGVPGTHDINLALKTISALSTNSGKVAVPRFDKANDNPVAQNQWPMVETPVDVIVFEGWCLGATAQEATALNKPINSLEEGFDPNGQWRHYVNDCLETQYSALFDTIDIWVMLKAPSFDCVHQWRLEQEQKLASKLQINNESLVLNEKSNEDKRGTHRLMSSQEIDDFIQHFQRLTEHMLDCLPSRMHHLYELDQDRHIIHERHKNNTIDR